MLKPAIPSNEDARLKDLYSFGILDTEKEKDYDDLVELVSQICNCPIASVTFIDSDRQWFKASKNLLATQGKRDESFCAHSILANEIFVVNDAARDERFFDNPDVTGGLKIAFYAGAPILSSNGYNLGTVCAIDKVPRKLSPEQLKALKAIANQISRLLDLRMKNKQVIQSARSLVSAQKKIAQMNMSDRESENYHTAYILHEDIAQAVSAVKFYIDMAKKDKELSDNFLKAGIEELTTLTNSITALSKKLTPTTFQQDNYKSHIEKLVVDFESKNKIKVAFSYTGNDNPLDKNRGLLVYRIIQDLLRKAALSGSKEISVEMKSKNGLHILYIHDPVKNMLESQRMMLQENIMNRVEMLGGNYSRKKFDNGKVEIKIEIPGS